MQPFALAMIRHVLTFAGGAIVARGYLDAATAEAVTGAVLTLVGAAWSLAEKRGRAA